MTQETDFQDKTPLTQRSRNFFRNFFAGPDLLNYDLPVFEEEMSDMKDLKLPLGSESDDDLVATSEDREVQLTLEMIDLQVLALAKPELESLVKRYFRALQAIAEIECKEGDRWCYEDFEIECEHNHARKILGEHLKIE